MKGKSKRPAISTAIVLNRLMKEVFIFLPGIFSVLMIYHLKREAKLLFLMIDRAFYPHSQAHFLIYFLDDIKMRIKGVWIPNFLLPGSYF